LAAAVNHLTGVRALCLHAEGAAASRQFKT